MKRTNAPPSHKNKQLIMHWEGVYSFIQEAACWVWSECGAPVFFANILWYYRGTPLILDMILSVVIMTSSAQLNGIFCDSGGSFWKSQRITSMLYWTIGPNQNHSFHCLLNQVVLSKLWLWYDTCLKYLDTSTKIIPGHRPKMRKSSPDMIWTTDDRLIRIFFQLLPLFW